MATFEDSRTAVADGAGRAELTWTWDYPIARGLTISRISVRATGSNTPQARIYRRGVESDAFFVAGTFTGSQDTAVFPEGHLVVTPFDPILIIWVGADAGAVCTASIEGHY